MIDYFWWFCGSTEQFFSSVGCCLESLIGLHSGGREVELDGWRELSRVSEPWDAGSWLWYFGSPVHGSLLHGLILSHILVLSGARQPGLPCSMATRFQEKGNGSYTSPYSVGIDTSEGLPGFKSWLIDFNSWWENKQACPERGGSVGNLFFFFFLFKRRSKTDLHTQSSVELKTIGPLLSWDTDFVAESRQVSSTGKWIQNRRGKKALLRELPIPSPKLTSRMSASSLR